MFFLTRIFFLIFCMVFPLLPVMAQTEQDPLVTQITVHNRDSTFRHLYIYNDRDEKTLETTYVLTGEEWMRKDQTEWIYISGLYAGSYFRKWDGKAWKTVHRINLEYTDENLMKETHVDFQNNTPRNVSNTVRMYEKNLLKSKTDHFWNGIAWEMKMQTNYDYIAENLISRLILKEFENDNPVKETIIDFKYNEFSKPDSLIETHYQNSELISKSLTMIYYDPVSKLKTAEFLKTLDFRYLIWKNVQNVSYRFNSSGKLIAENYQHWAGSFWINDLQYEYAYDADGKLVRKTTNLPIYDDYRSVSSVSYSDFRYGKASLIEAKIEFWGGETGEPIQTFIPYQFNKEIVVNTGSKIEISYIPVDVTGVNDIKSFENNYIRIYPNPSKGIFYFDNEKSGVTHWLVTDLSGKLLLTKEQKERSGVIDLGDFKPGVYLLQVFTPEGTKVQKLIKE